MAKKLVVKQIKSVIGRPETQRRTLAALGLGRIGKSAELDDNASIRGMIAKVSHLVTVVEK
ncbi:MAG: 50S ribosomal protein L30 [Alphaproteobacteria bacterium]|nr:50S ribosomal protein L30 [Alphaproteobacteria bacterium]MBQ6736780.1 50S ribosomal protein L30 [Alphaproteobacteria bacterium]